MLEIFNFFSTNISQILKKELIDKPLNDLVVVQADQFSEDGHTRVLADRDTGDITVEQMDD